MKITGKKNSRLKNNPKLIAIQYFSDTPIERPKQRCPVFPTDPYPFSDNGPFPICLGQLSLPCDIAP